MFDKNLNRNNDDGGPDYNWHDFISTYPADLGLKWLDNINNHYHMKITI